MNDFFPPFDWHLIFIEPWADQADIWFPVLAMAVCVTLSCGLVGAYLVLRRMALVGDAISHSVLPGLALAYLLAGTRDSWVIFAGALAAGLLTTMLIELIHKHSRVKEDAAIGVVFSTLFALGVLLITLFSSHVDLDADCVLYGELGAIALEPPVLFAGFSLGPPALIRMAIVTLFVAAAISLFYKELLATSFDPALSASLGIRVNFAHQALMAVLSIVIVSAFEAVGAIIVIAMLVIPPCFARLLSSQLPAMFAWIVFNALASSLAGLHLSIWLDCSIAGAVAVASFALFLMAWVFSPNEGLLMRWWRSLARNTTEQLPVADSSKS